MSLRSWLLTTDHKRIAILYMISITFFFFLGGAAAALIRYNLIVPEGHGPSAETYNRLFTMHGVDHGVVLPGAGGARHHRQLHRCR